MRSGFNPRRDATERTYSYRVGLDAGARSPFRRRWEWAVSPPFDIALAAHHLCECGFSRGSREITALGDGLDGERNCVVGGHG